ncbi:hypothetical protein ACH5RR_002293 [Cinchona calisaya]|uniref:Pentatricopeptide repeat-containing protein n=1 Tax=Cinchona calisaya TaxID=153742 RepID=A0ABD3B5U3_9GENT
MGRMNCAPNVCSYSAMMAAYREDRRMEDAERVWDEMGVEGLQPDIVAYDAVIGGLRGIGEVWRAEEKFREMSLSGLESSSVTYKRLVDGYCKIADVDSVILLYNDTCRKGFRPEGTTADGMIKLLFGSSMVSKALEIFRLAKN